MEIKVWKQKLYHNANVRARSFRQGDEVWVKNECKPGWHPAVVERITGKLSYEVLISGQMKRKHADQLRSRSGAMDDKPTATVVNQQQEVEEQESWISEQQLREQDLRPQPEVETQSLKKRLCEEGSSVDPTEATPNTIENGQKTQTSPNKSIMIDLSCRNQCYEGQSDLASNPFAVDLTNNF
ncbi:hypothetical protein J437_LFUL002892 [Ladona fulva]|uniref:Uncharacterized protein n=1 Tax=Ladona fulva TaxID=123851 RepID=A0A8K0KP68_LADFU|nr:hypothetical protein J437_LFUL002892 [Ladona fulva]